MMGIVHDALRRDLERTVTALSNAPFPDTEQRPAIGDHVAWMMGFLHAHHRGEDEGLWPAVRAADPGASGLVDQMEAAHARIVPAIVVCEEAARRYRGDSSDEGRVALLDSVVALQDVLLPHLRQEEDEMLPIASVALQNDEWRAIDQKFYVAPKSTSQLAFEGHWLLDGIDAVGRDIVLHQVPAAQRFVLVHGFARRYRRHAAACWGPGASRAAYGPAASLARRVPFSGRVDLVVDAPLDSVWDVLADVTRVGEWSYECHRVEWMDGAAGAVPGARFRGMNKAGPWTWSRVNEITAVDAPHALVWRTVSTLLFPDSTQWSYRLEAADDGTRIVQEYRLLRAPAILIRLYAMLIPSHRDRSSGLRDDLRRLGRVASSDAAANGLRAADASRLAS
jgi:hypothetical protein